MSVFKPKSWLSACLTLSDRIAHDFARAGQQCWPYLAVCLLLKVVLGTVLNQQGFFFQIYHLTTSTLFFQLQALTFVANQLMLGLVSLLFVAAVAHHAAARSLLSRQSLAPISLAIITTIITQIRWGAMANNVSQLMFGWPTHLSFLELALIGWACRFYWQGWQKLAHHFNWQHLTPLPLLVGILMSGLASWRYAQGRWLSFQPLTVEWWTTNLNNVTTPLGLTLGVMGLALIIWLGGLAPDSFTVNFSQIPLAASNLSAALIKGHLFGLPHPLNAHSVIDGYAQLAGYGQIVALCLVILMIKKHLTLAEQLATGLAFFNDSLGALFQMRLFFNRFLIFPFLLAPGLSAGLGSLLLEKRWLVPTTYLLPDGTPTLLTLFMGTNGQWLQLIVSALILMLSMGLYWPFVARMLQQESEVLPNDAR